MSRGWMMGALAFLLMCTQHAVAKRQITVPYNVVTSGEAQRGELAKQLVAMVHEDASDDDKSRLGAATLVGMDARCLYAVTANHVVRGAGGTARSIWLRTRWNTSKGVPAKVLAQHDAEADLAVVCVENPSRHFVPLPRMPFFLKGEPQTLVSNDALSFYGNGNAQDWHTATSAMTFRERAGNTLIAGGGGVLQGDSGGGLFSKDAVFDELVGIVLRGTEGRTVALDIRFVLSKLAAWNIPTHLYDWDFNRADEVSRQRYWESARFVEGYAPPQQSVSSERVKRLAVHLVGGPAGKATGLVVGAHNETVFVLVPWRVTDNTSARKLTVEFSGGASGNVSSLVSSPADDLSVLAVSVTYAVVSNLGLSFGEVWPGHVARFPMPPDSPLRIPVVDAGQLVAGTFAYLVGVDAPKSWKVLSREFKLVSSSAVAVQLQAPAVPRESIGWLAFDDRNRLIGVVSQVANRSATVSTLSSVLNNLKLPAGANRLEAWKAINLPIEITESGRLKEAARQCTFPRLLSYAHQDSAGDLTSRSGSVIVSGVSHMQHFDEADSFWVALDPTGQVAAVRRAGEVPLRGKPTFSRATVGDVVQLSHNVGSGSCGTVSVLRPDSGGLKRLCEGAKGFLPDAALPSAGVHLASGSVAVGGSIRAAGLAKVGIDGTTHILAEDEQAVQYASLVRHNDSVYVAGYGVRSGESEDVVVAAYDAGGSRKWRFSEAVPNSHERARSLVALSDGSVLVVGSVHAHGTLHAKLQLWRLSSSGQLLWKRTHGVTSGSAASDVVGDGAGGAVIAGSTTWNDGSVNGSTDGWLFAIDPMGNIKWQTTFAERYSAFGRRLVLQRLVDSADGYVLLAEVQASQMLGTNLLVLKVGRDGSLAAGCGK